MWHESKLNGWPWCHVSPSSQICVMGYYSGTKHTWTKTEYLSYLQFGVPPRAREEESKQRALRDYREGNIPPLFPLPSCVRMTQLFFSFFFFLHPLSLSSTSVNSFSRRVSPRGSQSGSPTLLLPQRCLKILCHAKFTANKKKRKNEKTRRTTFPEKWVEENNPKWTGGVSQWKNINFRAAVISVETELFAFLVDCCHETQCFAVFLPARHSSAKCDEM